MLAANSACLECGRPTFSVCIDCDSDNKSPTVLDLKPVEDGSVAFSNGKFSVYVGNRRKLIGVYFFSPHACPKSLKPDIEDANDRSKKDTVTMRKNKRSAQR